jgi:hypothetical protein
VCSNAGESSLGLAGLAYKSPIAIVGEKVESKMTDEPLPHAPRDISSQWPGRDVHHLILSAGDFIVFLDNDLDVDWSTSDSYDASTTEDDRRERSEILIRAASVECIPNDHQRANIRLNFKRMIAEGVARALEHDYDSAKKILEEARLYIADRNVEKARYWQLFTACIIGVAVMLSGAGLWALRAYLTRVWGEPAYFLVLTGAAGSLGAVLSMRAAKAKVLISTHFNTKQQVFLDFVLSQYVKVGVQELDQDKLSPLLKLKYNNAIADAVADLGRPEEIGRVFSGFQQYLYQRVA